MGGANSNGQETQIGEDITAPQSSNEDLQQETNQPNKTTEEPSTANEDNSTVNLAIQEIKAPSPSDEHRATGNTFYRKQEYMTAINYYNKALNIATKNEERCFAYKNISSSCLKMVVNGHAKKMEQIMYYLPECIKNGYSALIYSAATNQSEQWEKNLHEIIISAVNKFIEKLGELKSHDDMVSYVSRALNHFPQDYQSSLRSYLLYQCSVWFWQHAVVLRESENFVECRKQLEKSSQYYQFALEACEKSKNFGRPFMKCVDDKEMEDLADSLQFETLYATAAYEIQLGDEILGRSLNGEDYSEELVWDALDAYRRGLCSKITELDAKACAKMGEIYFRILKSTDLGVRYLQQFSDLSKVMLDESPDKDYVHVHWWTTGHAVWQGYIEKQQRLKDKADEEGKKPYKDMARKELDELKEQSGKGAHTFCQFSWNKYPAKDDYKLPALIPANDLKKVVQKLIVYYHTDKHVALWDSKDTEKRKKYVIYEDIAKQLSNFYQILKAAD